MEPVLSLLELRKSYEEDLETMQIKFTSLEHEVVRLKEVEKKFHHFKFVEKVIETTRLTNLKVVK